jgi:hypothetical protein
MYLVVVFLLKTTYRACIQAKLAFTWVIEFSLPLKTVPCGAGMRRCAWSESGWEYTSETGFFDRPTLSAGIRSTLSQDIHVMPPSSFLTSLNSGCSSFMDASVKLGIVNECEASIRMGSAPLSICALRREDFLREAIWLEARRVCPRKMCSGLPFSFPGDCALFQTLLRSKFSCPSRRRKVSSHAISS